MFLKACYKTRFYSPNACIFPRSPYLCNVFFIVLDLRLTKVGVQRYSFFYVRTFRMSRFSRLYYIVNRNKMRKIICHAECPFPMETPFDYDGDFPKLLSSFTYVPLDDNTSRFFRKPILFYYNAQIVDNKLSNRKLK